ncbi:hypothetical protein [Oceanicoccus sagamiensis]|uniref:Uncharacterized protein n=1 Tax=Oceanicoccus sagamiensis TaxID=716816 RepID=A0A1X9N9Y0_9GAMM|nr:hypothetical protein [Oceanicoccus sagamiensis]ARN72755.1 hypothetical protein BST96_00675 [Oceanicoccus sagamiensis]
MYRLLLKGLLLMAVILLAACESDNEHFCARYQYVYNQLLEDDLPSYGEMKSQLMENLNNPKKDKEQAKFMLFVLEDWYSEMKTPEEDTREFCMRIQRWQAYPSNPT